MADLTQLRTAIQTLLADYAQRRANQKDVEVQMIFDTDRDHYQLLYIGWQGKKRILSPILHLDIQAGKIWIQDFKEHFQFQWTRFMDLGRQGKRGYVLWPGYATVIILI